MDKKSLIKKIEEIAEEKGFSVMPYILAKKTPEELEKVLKEMQEAPEIKQSKPSEIKKIEEKQRRENPFNIPLTEKEARQWAENNLELFNSSRFIEWAKTAEGRRFLYNHPNTSKQLYEVIKQTRGIKEEIEKEKEALTKKAGRIGINPKTETKTLEELRKELGKIKKRKEELLKKEEELPGFLYLRKKEMKKLEEQRKKYARKR